MYSGRVATDGHHSCPITLPHIESTTKIKNTRAMAKDSTRKRENIFRPSLLGPAFFGCQSLANQPLMSLLSLYVDLARAACPREKLES